MAAIRVCGHIYGCEHTGDAAKQLPLWSVSDIVCCQEFWYASPETLARYVEVLAPRYRLHGLQRPGPDGASSRRPDGLFMAIRDEWEVLHEVDIDFEDAAGRCAQLLHLRRQPEDRALDDEPSAEPSVDELLVCNVHLLFSHNEASDQIRAREVHKLLTCLDTYKASLAAPPPALICGDLNGEMSSPVSCFLHRYGWRSAFGSARRGDSRRGAADAPGVEGGGRRWVSHLTHEREALGVDYIWLLNPSDPRPAVKPDWTDHVFSEVGADRWSGAFRL